MDQNPASKIPEPVNSATPEIDPTKFISEFFAIRFASSNARQTARYLELAFDFREIAYRGLETGASLVASHVLQCNDIYMEFMNPLITPTLKEPMKESTYTGEISKSEVMIHGRPRTDNLMAQGLSAINRRRYFNASINKGDQRYHMQQSCLELDNISFLTDFITTHGSGVSDIMFKVTDIDALYKHAVENGADPIFPPIVSKDKDGSVFTATVQIPSADVRHTFVQNIDYTGKYLPGYGGAYTQAISSEEPKIKLQNIDHCVLNFSWGQMTPNALFYEKAFGFRKFWSVDDRDVTTGRTGLRSIVMTNENGNVKIPINEPAKVRFKGQIEEFCDYNGGPGVQHVALRSTNLLSDVIFLRSRGLEFNTISEAYYAFLQKHLEDSGITLPEDMEAIRKNNILVDFDSKSKFQQSDGTWSCSYILQIFSKPVHDRPTFFFEFIQRNDHDGFGKGTFRGLFESIENEQRLRGTLDMLICKKEE